MIKLSTHQVIFLGAVAGIVLGIGLMEVRDHLMHQKAKAKLQVLGEQFISLMERDCKEEIVADDYFNPLTENTPVLTFYCQGMKIDFFDLYAAVSYKGENQIFEVPSSGKIRIQRLWEKSRNYSVIKAKVDQEMELTQRVESFVNEGKIKEIRKLLEPDDDVIVIEY